MLCVRGGFWGHETVALDVYLHGGYKLDSVATQQSVENDGVEIVSIDSSGDHATVYVDISKRVNDARIELCAKRPTLELPPTAIDDAIVKFTNTKAFTGAPIEPLSTVKLGNKTLKRGADYVIARYENNINAGVATVIIEGIGDYAGAASGTFTIRTVTVSGARIALAASSYTYTGEAITPAIMVEKSGCELVEGVDYTVAYSNNTNKGSGKITITGIGNYCSTRSTVFFIKAASIADADVKVRGATLSADGKALIPPTIVISMNGKELVADSDYTVRTSFNSRTRTGTLTIKGKGNYSGCTKVSFMAEEGLPGEAA